MKILQEIYKKYEVKEPEKLSTIEELLLDTESIDRSKIMMREHILASNNDNITTDIKYVIDSLNIAISVLDERLIASYLAIKEIVEDYLNIANVNEIYKVFFNLKEDPLKNQFKKGRYVIQINNVNLNLLKIDKNVEIISETSYNLGHYRKMLWDFNG